MPRKIVVGVDEAGRGPLAGPVVAAAVILRRRFDGLADSKMLTATRREELELVIKKRAICWAVGVADHHEIDRHNILQATFIAMRRALDQLSCMADLCLVDGNMKIPDVKLDQRAIIDGDQTEAAISAASILAKVHRDRLMKVLDTEFPGYGFAQHKGYCCPEHFEALRRLGPCDIHRRSFARIREMIEQPTLWSYEELVG